MLLKQYDEIISQCETLFRNKMKDYGATWLLFRYPSLLDQIWIKIKRIRVLEGLNDNSKIPEGRDSEFVGIINYSIIMLMRIKDDSIFPKTEDIIENTSLLDEINLEDTMKEFIFTFNQAKELMILKNHDYGDAWKNMHPYSITDQIIIKMTRIKNILKNDGKLLVSEDIDAQLFDIINYCIFALLKINELN